MINSIYGIMGTSASPIGNENIAQSVTRTGRFCNTRASTFICKRFKEDYGLKHGFMIHLLDESDEGYATEQLTECSSLGGDTDSCEKSSKIRIIREKKQLTYEQACKVYDDMFKKQKCDRASLKLEKDEGDDTVYVDVSGVMHNVGGFALTGKHSRVMIYCD